MTTDANTPDFSGVTDADLAQLSAEERALMEEMRAEVAADGAGDAEKQADADKGGEAGEGKNASDDAEQGQQDGQQEAEDAPPAPSMPAPLTPDNASEELARLNADRQKDMRAMMDGELDPEEYAKKDAEYLAAMMSLTQKQASDLTMQQLTVQRMHDDYSKQRQAVLVELKGYGLDVADDKVLKEFDRTVAMFSREAADDGVNDLPGNLANAAFSLKEAAALLQVRHKLIPKPPTPTPKQLPRRNELDRSTIPPTLANVPAAAVSQVTGEFDHLTAKMNAGADYAEIERDVARMSPEQQQRWLDAN